MANVTLTQIIDEVESDLTIEADDVISWYEIDANNTDIRMADGTVHRIKGGHATVKADIVAQKTPE